MPLVNMLFADDEELGKKDDEYRPSQHTPTTRFMRSWTDGTADARWMPPRRGRWRRWLIFLAALTLIYLFKRGLPIDPFHPLAPTHPPSPLHLPPRRHSSSSSSSATYHHGPRGPDYTREVPQAPPELQDTEAQRPPKGHGHGQDAPESKHFYDGDITFPLLPSSLQYIAKAFGYGTRTRNVLFVAANVQSAARLIPIACEMGRWDRNVVHFGYMGRDDVSLENLQEMNGAATGCDIYWHDGRPDYAPFSTDVRMATSVLQALQLITTFMHPQVYLSDNGDNEFEPFMKALRWRAKKDSRTLIELPTDASRSLMWITRLDYGALKAWHETYVDIVIQTTPESSGPLLRLLRSIESADYFGVRRPHLTIELMNDIDPHAQRYLDQMQWPPADPNGRPGRSELTIRRRLSAAPTTPLEASTRLIESFFPTRQESHVLVLSPLVELSPLYFHFLYFHLLEYVQSAYSAGSVEMKHLMGIGLTRPEYFLDGVTPFTVDDDEGSSNSSSFLWQAPDPYAALYFGQHWVNLHDFVTNRLSHPSSALPRTLPAYYPAYAEPVEELMRLRGLTFLYPSMPSHVIATAGDSVYLPPESLNTGVKFDDTGPQDPYRPHSPRRSSSAALEADRPEVRANGQDGTPGRRPLAPGSSTLQSLLTRPNSDDAARAADAMASTPFSTAPTADLPELRSLPVLSWDGRPAPDIHVLIQQSNMLAHRFRLEHGGCTTGGESMGARQMNYAPDLFCEIDASPVLSEEELWQRPAGSTTPDRSAATADGVDENNAGSSSADRPGPSPRDLNNDASSNDVRDEPISDTSGAYNFQAGDLASPGISTSDDTALDKATSNEATPNQASSSQETVGEPIKGGNAGAPPSNRPPVRNVPTREADAGRQVDEDSTAAMRREAAAHFERQSGHGLNDLSQADADVGDADDQSTDASSEIDSNGQLTSVDSADSSTAVIGPAPSPVDSPLVSTEASLSASAPSTSTSTSMTSSTASSATSSTATSGSKSSQKPPSVREGMQTEEERLAAARDAEGRRRILERESGW